MYCKISPSDTQREFSAFFMNPLGRVMIIKTFEFGTPDPDCESGLVILESDAEIVAAARRILAIPADIPTSFT